MKIEIEKVITLQLTEEEALDLRSLLHNNIEEFTLYRPQELLVHKLKELLNDL